MRTICETRKTMQVCNQCGKEFPVLYRVVITENAHGVYNTRGGYGYEYIGGECSCESGFSPAAGEPSLAEWAEETMKMWNGDSVCTAREYITVV